MAHRFLAFAAAAVMIAASRIVAQGAGLNTQMMVAAPAVSVSPAPATVGASVAITFATSVSRTSPYGLDFGDTQQGSIAPGKPVVHVYGKAGTFLVRVLDGANVVAQVSLVVQVPFHPQMIAAAAMPAAIASPSPSPMKLELSSEALVGQPATFTLEAPSDVNETCPVLFSDEQSGDSARILPVPTIQTRGTLTRTFSQFGRFFAKVESPCAAPLLHFGVMPPIATRAERDVCMQNWELIASPKIAAVNQDVLFILCAPLNANQTCKISFGDGQPGGGVNIQSASPILARSTITHRYVQYGTFTVKVDPPCQAAPVTFTVNPPG
jgi:hypothetical protein